MLLNCGGGGGYYCVVEVGWHWGDATFSPAMALASAPVDRECRWCTITL
jgi:hypothetical protein